MNWPVSWSARRRKHSLTLRKGVKVPVDDALANVQDVLAKGEGLDEETVRKETVSLATLLGMAVMLEGALLEAQRLKKELDERRK